MLKATNDVFKRQRLVEETGVSTSCFISSHDDCSENKSSVQTSDEIKSPNSDIIIENLPDAEFSDPAHEETILSKSKTISPPMFITLKKKSKYLACLIDSGAGANCLTERLVKTLNLKTVALTSTKTVTLADGKTTLAASKCIPNLVMEIPALGNMKIRQTFYVLPSLTNDQDVILGCPWLDDDKVSLHFGDVRTISVRGQTFKPHASALAPADIESALTISSISAKATNRLSKKKDCELYLFHVKLLDDTKDKTKFTEYLKSVENSQLKQLLSEYTDVFPDELPDTLPPKRPLDHKIELKPNSVPPAKKQYRLSDAELKELKIQIDTMLKKGLIRVSHSPYGAPVLFVKKKNGKLRMCVDWRALNKMTIKNRYPLPRIDDHLDRIGEACVFSTGDMLSGYNQLRMHPESIEKTAFVCRYGQFEYLVAGFGLCNLPSNFMTLMNEVFHDYLDKFCLVYLDDLLIYSKTEAEHLEHLRLILDRLRLYNLYLGIDKCTFMSSSVEYLGHVISADGIRMDPKKIEAISKWQILHNVADVRSFLGLINYYRRFIPNLAKIASPLHFLLRKDSPFVWTPECRSALDSLKSIVTSDPVLRPPNFSRSFSIHADASGHSLGACLMQEFDDGPHPVAYHSRTFSPAERNYDIRDKENLAIVDAFRTWRPYVLGNHTTVYTDHRSLEYLMTQSNLKERQARWLEELAAFDFDIVYKKGSSHVVPDALSRIPLSTILCASTCSSSSIDSSFSAEVQLAYRSDPMFQTLKQHRNFRLLGNGLLYFHNTRLYIPRNAKKLITKILRECHDSTSAGHFGIEKTYAKTASRFYWINMISSVKRYIRSCVPCQMNKATNQKRPGLLFPHRVPSTRAWSHVSLDFIFDLPKSKDGHDGICTIVDKFSKQTHFVSCTKQDNDGEQAAKLYFNNIYRLHVMIIRRQHIYITILRIKILYLEA